MLTTLARAADNVAPVLPEDKDDGNDSSESSDSLSLLRVPESSIPNVYELDFTDEDEFEYEAFSDDNPVDDNVGLLQPNERLHDVPLRKRTATRPDSSSDEEDEEGLMQGLNFNGEHVVDRPVAAYSAAAQSSSVSSSSNTGNSSSSRASRNATNRTANELAEGVGFLSGFLTNVMPWSKVAGAAASAVATAASVQARAKERQEQRSLLIEEDSSGDDSPFELVQSEDL